MASESIVDPLGACLESCIQALPLNRLTKMIDDAMNHITELTYDHVNRLLTLNHVKTPTTIESLTYTYDPAGNHLSQTRANAAASNLPTAVAAAQITYDAANELLRWNNATNNLTYDLNENLATEKVGGVTTTYTWDSRNRLTGISKTGLTASFAYDGLGRRKSKTINGTTTGFWYDGNDVYAELSGATPAFTYIRGFNLDEPYIRKGTSDEFYEIDALGSPVNLTNAAGTTAVTYTYEPFGTTTQSGISSNSFQFTGRENDGTTGHYYYRERYYGPVWKRFTGNDPIGLGGGVNAYAYAANNPLRLLDPLGLYPDCIDFILGTSVSIIDQIERDYTSRFRLPVPIPIGGEPGFDPGNPHPRRPRPPSPKPAVNIELWEVEYTVGYQKINTVTQTIQHLQVICSDTIALPCGKTEPFTSIFTMDKPLDPIINLKYEGLIWRAQKLRLLATGTW